MGLIPILLISAGLWEAVCVDLDPLGAPFVGECLLFPLSDRTSKAMQGVAVILSFITRSFALIYEGTPDAPPLFESHKRSPSPPFPSTRGAKCCVIWV